MNGEGSNMNMKTQVIAILVLFFSCASGSAQEKIVVGGSGSLNEEVTDLAKAYMAKNPADAIEVRPESMSSEGGIAGTPAGVAFHKSIPVTNLAEAQICDVFGGRIKSWKDVGGNDAKITVLTRKKDDNNTEAFREKMSCFKDLTITAEAIALVRGSEILAALDKRPGTVGIVNLGSSFNDYENIKAVAINGVIPAPEAARSGKYRYFSERGLVTQGEPKGLTKRFIEFMATAEGRKIIGSQGAIPVR